MILTDLNISDEAALLGIRIILSLLLGYLAFSVARRLWLGSRIRVKLIASREKKYKNKLKRKWRRRNGWK